MKVLMPVDGSEQALKAVEKAALLAKEAEVTVISVIPIFEEKGFLTSSTEGYLKGRAERAVADAKALLEGKVAKVTTKLLTGTNVANVILGEAKEGYDLVVIGHRGLGGAKLFLMGSVAERVAKHAPCSVFIVR